MVMVINSSEVCILQSQAHHSTCFANTKPALKGLVSSSFLNITCVRDEKVTIWLFYAYLAWWRKTYMHPCSAETQ